MKGSSESKSESRNERGKPGELEWRLICYNRKDVERFFLLTDIKINKITLNYEMKCEEGKLRMSRERWAKKKFRSKS
jgi:hypothetical protein